VIRSQKKERLRPLSKLRPFLLGLLRGKFEDLNQGLEND